MEMAMATAMATAMRLAMDGGGRGRCGGRWRWMDEGGMRICQQVSRRHGHGEEEEGGRRDENEHAEGKEENIDATRREEST